VQSDLDAYILAAVILYTWIERLNLSVLSDSEFLQITSYTQHICNKIYWKMGSNEFHWL